MKIVKFDHDSKKINDKQINKKLSQEFKQRQRVEKTAPTIKQPAKPKRNKAKSYSRQLRQFFLGFFLTLVLVGVVLVSASTIIYDRFFYNDVKKLGFDTDNSKSFAEDLENEEVGNKSIFTQVPKKTKYNFALFGTDIEGTRTDFMIIGSYDLKENLVKLMSVPRDTYTIMPEERIQALRDDGIDVLFRQSGIMKMNEVHHNAGSKYGVAYLLAQLEETFKVDFDFYVKFNLEGFRYFIDEIGGVEFNVPQRMYYNDPEQSLYIDLYPGLQPLNGKQAEGVVRYRRADINNPISPEYPRGDLDRINVQQDFITALIKKVTSSENILSTIPALFSTGAKYIDTNVKISDITTVLPYLSSFNMEDLEITVMPYIDEEYSYVYVKEPDTGNLINVIFYDGKTNEIVPDTKELNISVLNGSYTSGLATKTANELKVNGYNVTYIGDYNGNKLTQSEIRVKTRGTGEDLKEFFPDAFYRVDSTLSQDVEIILGIQN